MPPKVEPIDSIPQRGQVVHHIQVASAVFAEPVDNRQDSPGFFLFPPGLEV
jgi:hypothetical protein